jgi:hypothetical protein
MYNISGRAGRREKRILLSVWKISPGVSALHRRRLLGLSVHGTRRSQRSEVILVGLSGHGGTPSVGAAVAGRWEARVIAGVGNWGILWNRKQNHGRSQCLDALLSAIEGGKGRWRKGHGSLEVSEDWIGEDRWLPVILKSERYFCIKDTTITCGHLGKRRNEKKSREESHDNNEGLSVTHNYVHFNRSPDIYVPVAVDR